MNNILIPQNKIVSQMAGIVSNPNLLDNGFFQVNQRGQSSYASSTTENKYSVDRWQMREHVGLTVLDRGVTITATDRLGLLAQFLELKMLCVGSVYTLSIMLQDGAIHSVSFELAEPVAGHWMTIAELTVSESLTVRFGHTDTPLWYCGIRPSAGSSATVLAIKLELGPVSTLANDSPPDYATELLKCQRYFIRIGGHPYASIPAVGVPRAGTQNIYFNLPFSMRTSPTVTAAGRFLFQCKSGNITLNNLTIAYDGRSETAIRVYVGLGSTPTDGAYILMTNNDTTAHIDFSADL